MNIVEEITVIAKANGAEEVKEKKGKYSFAIIVAERKAFLSTRKLQYQAQFRVDEEGKKLLFSEMLTESGAGLSTGDTDTPGFGFKAETYKTGTGPREGSITEQSDLFGKKYDYQFDFKKIRTVIKDKARDFGYEFDYKVLGV